MRLSPEEEKAVELILKGEYEIFGGLEYCYTRGIYYFFEDCATIRVVHSPEKVLLFDFSDVTGTWKIQEIRVRSAGCYMSIPDYGSVLAASVSLGYEPSANDIFNISSDAEYNQSNDTDGIIHISERECNDSMEDLYTHAVGTKMYIEELEEERSEWQSAAEALVGYIQDHINCKESTKEDLQRNLDKLTYHHLVNNKENK